MPMYETMLVTSTTLDEEATKAVVGKFTKLIEKNGKIDTIDEWGKRRLAYPINKEEDGFYTLIHFTSEPDFPAELDRVYKITDGILRSLIIAKDEVMEAARLDAASKAEAAKAAAAERIARAEAEKAKAAEEAKAAAEAAPAQEEAPAEAQAEAEEAAPAQEQEATE